MADAHKQEEGEGERDNHDERDDRRAPRQQPDFAMLTRWTDDTFKHLKTLFQFEVAKHVTTRMLTLGTVILTTLGILGAFGLQQGIDLAVEDVRRRAETLIADAIRDELEVQMKEMEVLITAGKVQLAVSEALMDESSSDMTVLSNDIRTRIGLLANVVDDQALDVRSRINELKAFSSELDTLDQQLQTYSRDLTKGRRDIDSLLVESRKLVELSVIPLLSIDSLLERLEAASRDLGAAGSGEPDAHERAVVQAIIETLGAKEFKKQEEVQKERVVGNLQAIFVRRPPSGFVNYNDDVFREIRVKAVTALRSLSERSPLPEAGIQALTEMLEDVGRFGERDGAAWALGVLADEDLFAEVDEGTVTDAVGALTGSLTRHDEEEVQRVALNTLRRIATTTGFKSRFLSRESRQRVNAALAAEDEALRKNGVEVLRAIVHAGSEEWLEELRALLENDSDEVRSIAAGILAEVFPNELIREAAMQPDLERELTEEVETARQAVAADFKARARRRFSERRWDDAIENYLRYLDLRPDDITVERDVAELYLLAGKYDKAKALAEKTIESASDQRVLDQLTIVAAMALAGEPPSEEKAKLLELQQTSPMRIGYWSFDTLREHLIENDKVSDQTRAEILELIRLIEPRRMERRR